ncbi:hypothetical protein B0T18DRAFT_325983 [Schizothecium vesticola]|uniref:Uncharacterized protein n=1 Tax=Schizothecium vesticola TaxID=314040 RepID=A0AA40EV48_9PEZI|nr:hypothetical protein B0T18DRAFT_325983 [Schizothecium vesticola]
MGGLIPLMLGSGNRLSYIPPPTPTIKIPPSLLPVLPYTPSEWKRAIADVKKQHLTKRYRSCAARCTEILDNVKDTSQVEPVYIINLHYYAATSMELCARTLPPASRSRTSLLQQARAHFDRAAMLIDAAEDSVVTKTRSGSVSSRTSSCHSPAGSISSRAATPETRLSSPTNSVCSFDAFATKTPTHPNAPPAKRVKKVSFSLPNEEIIDIPETPFRIPEPLVRPDSPTLGFDDEYFHSGAARQFLPELPKSPFKFQEAEYPLYVVEEEPLQLIPEDDSFLMARTVDRFCENLSGLRSLLARHSTSIEELMAAKHGDDSARPRSLLLPAAADDSEELRRADRQARIERLRKNGWQRKRFDARRYEELCETVLLELA